MFWIELISWNQKILFINCDCLTVSLITALILYLIVQPSLFILLLWRCNRIWMVTSILIYLVSYRYLNAAHKYLELSIFKNLTWLNLKMTTPSTKSKQYMVLKRSKHDRPSSQNLHPSHSPSETFPAQQFTNVSRQSDEWYRDPLITHKYTLNYMFGYLKSSRNSVLTS